MLGRHSWRAGRARRPWLLMRIPRAGRGPGSRPAPQPLRVPGTA